MNTHTAYKAIRQVLKEKGISCNYTTYGKLQLHFMGMRLSFTDVIEVYRKAKDIVMTNTYTDYNIMKISELTYLTLKDNYGNELEIICRRKDD